MGYVMSDEKNTDELNLNDDQKQALQELLDALEDNHPDNTQDNKQNTNPSVRLPTSSNNNDSSVSKSTFMSSIQKLPGGSYLHGVLTFFGDVASKFVSAMKMIPFLPVHPFAIFTAPISLIASAIASAATYYAFGSKALEAPAKDVANTSLDKLNASLPEGVKKIENFDVDSLRAAKDSVVAVKQKNANVSKNVGERLSIMPQSSRFSSVETKIAKHLPSEELESLKSRINALFDKTQERAKNLATSAKNHSAPQVTNTNDPNSKNTPKNSI